jgi:hypothetical protein
MKKIYQSRIAVILITLFMFATLAACAGPQTVKPYAVVKATAEEILYDVRILQNQGTINATDFELVKATYSKVKAAQDVVIDARKALITVNSAENQQRVNVAVIESIKLLSELQALAVQLGVKGVK